MEATDLLSSDHLEWSDKEEDTVDSLLLQASQEYESDLHTRTDTTATPTLSSVQLPAIPSPSTSTAYPTPACFAPPRSEGDIVRARRAGVPESTKKDTKYCMQIWEEWKIHREQNTHTTIPPLPSMPVVQLSSWLTCFILEARKKNGEPYPPNTLHHIVMGLMRFLRWNGRQIDILKDADFCDFRASLDAEMKRLVLDRISVKPRSLLLRRKTHYGRGGFLVILLHRLY